MPKPGRIDRRLTSVNISTFLTGLRCNYWAAPSISALAARALWQTDVIAIPSPI